MRPAMLLCGAALAGLAGCATHYDPNHTLNPPNPDPMPSTTLPQSSVAITPVAPAPVVVVPAAATLRAGNGVVHGVQLVQPAVVTSASAGGSVAAASAYRLTVRMDDGSTQVLDQSSSAFRVGDRIQVTNDGRLLRY